MIKNRIRIPNKYFRIYITVMKHISSFNLLMETFIPIHNFLSSGRKRAHLVKDGEALLHPARGWGIGTVGVLGPVQHLLLYSRKN
jgi:hypothetical protein